MKETYIEAIKKAIRVSGDFDEEIKSYISACRLDMQSAGIPQEVTDNEDDSLVKAAIILYLKASFGIDQKYSERDMNAYERLKISLKNSSHSIGDIRYER